MPLPLTHTSAGVAEIYPWPFIDYDPTKLTKAQGLWFYAGYFWAIVSEASLGDNLVKVLSGDTTLLFVAQLHNDGLVAAIGTVTPTASGDVYYQRGEGAGAHLWKLNLPTATATDLGAMSATPQNFWRYSLDPVTGWLHATGLDGAGAAEIDPATSHELKTTAKTIRPGGPVFDLCFTVDRAYALIASAATDNSPVIVAEARRDHGFQYWQALAGTLDPAAGTPSGAGVIPAYVAKKLGVSTMLKIGDFLYMSGESNTLGRLEIATGSYEHISGISRLLKHNALDPAGRLATTGVAGGGISFYI